MSSDFNEKIDEILKNTKIEDVVGEYIRLRPAGRRFMAVCPFHGDKDPSLSVNTEKGLWYCFGCGAGGNVFSFIMKIENMTFHEAAEFLARKAGVSFEMSPQQSRERAQKERFRAALKAAAFFYHEKLFTEAGAAALSYLRRRKISDAAIRRFGLGFAPPGRITLSYYLQQQGFGREEIAGAGLANLREVSLEPADVFRNRITIPILDSQNRFIGMGGRALEEGVPKYINSPETVLFVKGKSLFGINVAKRYISKADEAVLVEGYFDQIMLWQEGVKNTVASLGTALTPDQARLLRKFCSRCIVAYDSDSAGKMATVKGVDIFEQAGIASRILVLEEGYDPDSYLREKGAELFRAALGRSMEIVDYTISRLHASLDTESPSGKSEFVKTVVPVLAKLQDPVIRYEYVRRVSESVHVSEELLRQMLPGAGISSSRKKPGSSEADRIPVMPLEERLLQLLLHFPFLIDRAKEELSLSDIANPVLARIYEIIFSLDTDHDFKVEDFSDYAQEEGIIGKVTELIMSENMPSSSESIAEELANELLKKLRDDKLKVRFRHLKKEVEEALSKNTMEHHDERFIEYQRLYQYFKGRK